MSIFDLIDAVGKADAATREQEIFAPVSAGSNRIRTSVAGMVREFRIPRQRESGLKMFRSTGTNSAEYTRDADEDEIRQFMELLPKVMLILVYQDSGHWYGFPAHLDSFKARCGDLTLVRVQRPEDTLDRFDYVIARYGGNSFWYDDTDYRIDPDKLDALREGLQTTDWSKVRRGDVDDPATYAIDFRGLTEEDRISYQIAARRIIQETKSTIEQQLDEALTDVNAKLDSFVERGDNLEVKWVNSSGQPYTTVVQKEGFQVVTAGICVSGEDRKFDLKSLVGVVNYAEGAHGVVRVGHGHMGEDVYFDVHPEPDALGDRGQDRWQGDW